MWVIGRVGEEKRENTLLNEAETRRVYWTIAGGSTPGKGSELLTYRK